MLQFTPHAGNLPTSETLAITARANRMRAQGIDIAPFAAGEPDFDTAVHVKEAAIEAIRAGCTKYAPAAGIAPLRAAVAERFRRNGHEGIGPEQTIVGTGAKGVLYTALQVLVGEGDEVLIPTPAWLSYPYMVQAAGGRSVFVETHPEDGYVLDPDRLRAAVTPRTKAILLNSPGNPTGTIQPDEIQAAVGRIALEHGLLVISDEIYEHLVYAPARFRSFAALAPQARESTLLVNGVSKAYAMTGWRIGYGGGPKELIQRMTRLQSHATSGTPEICQRAALAALEGPMAEVKAMCATFGERRRVMYDALQAIEGLHCRLPDGAFYMLPDVRAHLGRRFEGKEIDSVATLAEMLIEHAHAAVVPGGVFEAPYAIRFSYACSDDHIRRGLARVKDFLAALD
ncbi:MAG: pyridoxal phosphate-dependent aminotransferase [Planctomycetota bacterium]